MQLAMLAPYSNLATSVAAALVPTLLGPAKMKGPEENEPVNANKNAEEASLEGGNTQQILFYHKPPIQKYTYFLLRSVFRIASHNYHQGMQDRRTSAKGSTECYDTYMHCTITVTGTKIISTGSLR